MTIENSVQHNTNSLQLLASFKNCKMSRRYIAAVASSEMESGALQDITDDEFELKDD